jgi:hydroxyacylglutathione hydrolase
VSTFAGCFVRPAVVTHDGGNGTIAIPINRGRIRRSECEEGTMIVKQIWTDNKYRNFNYLIACPETGEALAIDPLDHAKCLAEARKAGWTITQVLNTHEHGDHIGGNKVMVAETGARLLAHRNAKDKIPGIDVGLGAGDVIRVGRTVELESLDTPGHTMSHVCLLSHTDTPALFCGDTLFNAGAGNCHSGGHPEELYRTFVRQLAALPDATEIYPGHDYIANNLKFTLDREPDNSRASTLLAQVEDQDPAHPMVTTLGLEKAINTFFRLHNPTVIARLREAFPDLPDSPDEKTVFIKLRELRNSW